MYSILYVYTFFLSRSYFKCHSGKLCTEVLGRSIIVQILSFLPHMEILNTCPQTLLFIRIFPSGYPDSVIPSYIETDIKEKIGRHKLFTFILNVFFELCASKLALT